MTSAGTKRCSKCRTLKPLSEFNKRKASPDGYTYKCKVCEKATAKMNYHKRKKRLGGNKYYQDHKDEIKMKSREYYEKNKEHLLRKNKEYRQKNPEVHAKSVEKRKKILAERMYVQYSRNQVIKRDTLNGVVFCYICGQPIKDMNDLQIDHIVPVTAGGWECLYNVRCAHSECNRRRPLDGKDTKVRQGREAPVACRGKACEVSCVRRCGENIPANRTVQQL